jgi:hypothetical protein
VFWKVFKRRGAKGRSIIVDQPKLHKAESSILGEHKLPKFKAAPEMGIRASLIQRGCAWTSWARCMAPHDTPHRPTNFSNERVDHPSNGQDCLQVIIHSMSTTKQGDRIEKAGTTALVNVLVGWTQGTTCDCSDGINGFSCWPSPAILI